MYRWGVAKNCKMCGKALESYSRPDREFCDQNCRKAWSRRSEKIKAYAADVRGRLADLRQLAHVYPDLHDLIKQETVTIIESLEGITDVVGVTARPDKEGHAAGHD